MESNAAQTDCPACEEGYICRQGEGCLLVEVIDQADARSAGQVCVNGEDTDDAHT